MATKNISSHLQSAVEIAGSQVALARLVGVGEKTVWAWIHRGTKVNEIVALKIERATKGAVRCEDLRPDVDWAFIRGAGRSKAA